MYGAFVWNVLNNLLVSLVWEIWFMYNPRKITLVCGIFVCCKI